MKLNYPLAEGGIAGGGFRRVADEAGHLKFDAPEAARYMVQTLVMLSALPFPKHLRAVPEIAGGHHEKMDGSGYLARFFAYSPTRSRMARMTA